MKLEDHIWHDKILLSICIDRSNPGVADKIIFEIQDYNEVKKLVFTDVYWLKSEMNFGIIAQESILNIMQIQNDDKDVIALYQKWKGLLKGLDLFAYEIELNSSASKIKIIAQEVMYY